MSNTTLASDHAQRIRCWFDLSSNPPIRFPDYESDPPQPGQLHLITGPSGSGKSLLLRRLRRRWHREFSIYDLDATKLPRSPTIECFSQLHLEDALHLLSRVGLAEAHTWILPTHHLSQGQQWRLKLAIALMNLRNASRPAILFADEFAGCLDPLTARIISHTLRRQVHTFNLRVLIATSRNDLLNALQPDHVTQCDFGTFVPQ
ncbi:MAG: ATP-binding cassette domain-containing protein [Phycisphaerales bacterium]|jgi:ABC-type ATPase with predicted acetyltransferase domain|nr:ATP-binding cassette domain-containing protein [Phycisphaerales bacterium]